MAKRSRKQQYRAEKEAIIKQKEGEDAHGIKRKVKYGYNDGLGISTIRIIKAVLLAAGIVSYFMYSVLLFPLVFIYGLLYFSIKQKERNLNYGLRKELWVKLPKFDSLIAIIIVICTISIVGLSAMSMGSRTSVFAGKNEAQVYQILVQRGTNQNDAQERAKEMIANGMTLATWERYMYQAGSLLTGHRELFQPKYQNTTSLGGAVVRRMGGNRPSGGGGGGGNGVMKIKQPDGSTQTFQGRRPAGFGGPSMGMNPMMLMSITQMFSTVNLILLLLVVAGGSYVAMTKKGRDEEQIKKDKKPIIAKSSECVEMMRIKTIKNYTDSLTGETFEVGDIRTITKDRGEPICKKGYAIEFVSKTERHQQRTQQWIKNGNR